MTYFNFGNNQRRLGGLFDTTSGIGSRKPWDTPGIGDGIGSSVDFEPGTDADTGIGNPPVAGAAPQASKWDKFSDNMSNLAQGLGAAQAFWSGDTDTGASILQSGAKARQMAEAAARKQREAAAEIEARRQRAIAAGIDPAKADLIGHGDTKFSDIYAKPTSEMQNFGFYNGLDEAGREAYGRYKDVADPLVTHGYGSTVVSRSELPQAGGLPAGYNPEEWEVTATPGQASAPGQNAPVVGARAPFDAQMMERLYVQQFGEARGRPMYQEWLRAATRGGR